MLTIVCYVQFFFAVSGAGNTTSLVMILTELTGLYAISSVLLIRKQLPLKYRQAPACLQPAFLPAPVHAYAKVLQQCIAVPRFEHGS